MGGRMRIGDMMLRAGLIDELQLNAALAHQRQWGGKLGSTMVELGFVDEELLWKGLARQTGLARVELATLQVSMALVQRVPVDLCEKHGVFPVAYQDQTKSLTMATADPNNMRAMDEFSFRTGWKAVPVLASETEIQWAIRRYYRNDPSPCPPLRKKKAPVQQTSAEDEEEFKITDVSGKTVMKKLSDIKPPPAAPPPPPQQQYAPPPQQQYAPPQQQQQYAPPQQQQQYAPPPQQQQGFGAPRSVGGGFGMPASVAAMPPGAQLTPELEALKSEMEKGNRLLKSVVEMCIARGIFTQQEFLERLRR